MKMPFETDISNSSATESRKRILIVDDEQSILNALAQVLTIVDSNITVDVASSAEQALTALNTKEVDVVITDLMLPQMNGLDLSKAIREKSPQTKLILMTAYGNEFIQQQAQHNGCLAYIEKPFEIDQILSCLSDVFSPKVRLQLALRKFVLSDIIKLFDSKQESGVLLLTVGQKQGYLILDNGNLVDAKLGTESGVIALSQIVAANNLSIEETDRHVSEKRTFLVTWEDISIAEQILDSDARIKFLSKSLPHKSEKNSVTSEEVVNQLNIEANGHNENSDRLTAISKTLATVNLSSEQSSDSAGKFINAGVGHFNAKRYEQARLCWQLALKLNPKSESAKNNLAVLAEFLS
jgi:CheY-like chemotaxis protein